jgi:hypothetical protein
MSCVYIYGAPSKARNLASYVCILYIYGRDFLLGILLLEPCIFVNICVKNQQIHQLFIQFINYVWYIQHVPELNCHF